MKRALISLTNKDGIVPFAAWLIEREFTLISTGGTAELLRNAGLQVTDVMEVTGIPEGMDGRLKTISPFISGGILADRSKEEHLKYLADNQIGMFDLVVVNLYAFNAAVESGVDLAGAIEKIDIGGPSLLRAAAKNHKWCLPICDPADYDGFVQMYDKTGGELEYVYRLAMAVKVFAVSHEYDGEITAYLNRKKLELCA